VCILPIDADVAAGSVESLEVGQIREALIEVFIVALDEPELFFDAVHVLVA